LAKPLPPVCFARGSGSDQTIGTILCDSGHKYQSTLLHRDWLAGISIQTFPWNDARTQTSEKIFESGNEESTFPEKRCFLHS
jgi:hypothetical protein